MVAQKMEVTNPLSFVLNIYPYFSRSILASNSRLMSYYAPYPKIFTAPAINTILLL